jgi:hypothetical protein
MEVSTSSVVFVKTAPIAHPLTSVLIEYGSDLSGRAKWILSANIALIISKAVCNFRVHFQVLPFLNKASKGATKPA